MAWLKGFLERSGAPVGTYSWGKVSAFFDRKGGCGLATISYAAQQGHARDARNARA